eukprot:119693-Amphidinium_carterae.1
MISERVIMNYCLLEVITNSAGTRTSPSELVDEMAVTEAAYEKQKTEAIAKSYSEDHRIVAGGRA